MHNVLILNYHAIETGKPSVNTPEVQALTVTRETFEAQLALINKLRMPVVSLDQVVEAIYKGKRWHRHVLAITFDGGNETDYEVAYPLLKHYSFPAAFFITVQNQTSPESWAQYRKMAAAGFLLGSHTLSGSNLLKLPGPELHKELTESKRIIEAETGTEVKYLSVPEGCYNREVMFATEDAGYEAMFTSTVGVNRWNAHLYQLKRWTIHRKTTLKEFENMLHRNPRELQLRQMQSQVHDSGVKLMHRSPFQKIKHFFFGEK
ncbi:polysaccharide deacetylase family protein [Adhaeribacter soli]|uniref:Polysaccharide deacetylase family protein n=1 Tax=Adhaeribacter soli TaxID=2607655 RepID=A0A5N1IZY0_9BACT|nr:polysaccharide deacetylase family protein [Adhaeribacter soli]KAA9333652.1 polysaccharide deacetylase family protein [Adhaeribacter soli]